MRIRNDVCASWSVFVGALLALTWINPPDADLLYVRFYALKAGSVDTLRSSEYSPVVAGAPDTARFALPCTADSVTWYLWATATDTTGRNESGPSNIVTLRTKGG